MSEIDLKKKILLVDDEPKMRWVLRKILERAGHDTLEANNGAQALEIVRKENIDIVITDVDMPQMSGLDLFKELKSNFRHIPVIIMTGKASVEAAVDCIHSGAIDYITKPVTILKIKDAIQRALDVTEAHGQNLRNQISSKESLSFLSGYRVVRPLGEGNMGIVYLVEKTTEGKKDQYALKIFRHSSVNEGSHEKLKTRFMNEAKTASAISHPNIVKIFDFELAENKPVNYILMEYISGKTLQEIISQQVELDHKQKSRIICQVADGLNEIHKLDIFHRDIKPDNIMIDENLNVKITDFGIAKLPNSRLTQHFELMGTPMYMAPESFSTAQVDGRADIFSLGIMTYELFLGRHPFKANALSQIYYLIQKEQPISPREIDADFPDQLLSILEKMLEKDPDRRPSLKEVCNHLNAFIDSVSSETTTKTDE